MSINCEMEPEYVVRLYIRWSMQDHEIRPLLCLAGALTRIACTILVRHQYILSPGHVLCMELVKTI